MCADIYIGSNSETILSSDELISLRINLIEEETHISKKMLKVNRTYEIGSFMGCSCGFAIWPDAKDYQERRTSLTALKNFLMANHSSVTGLVTFFKYDNLEGMQNNKKMLHLSHLDAEEFHFEDDAMYVIANNCND